MASDGRLLTQKELASFLDLTTRQIRNLEKDGILSTKPLGARKFYPWPTANHEYIAYRESLKGGAGPSNLEKARQRKMEAEAEIAELRAAETRGELVPIALHLDRVGELLDRLRSQILAIPGYWGPELVGAADVRDAVSRIRPLAHELLEDLSQMAESWTEEGGDA